ncbi:MAG: DNA-binding protein [SAR202 cluster bacterium]|nr:DNA-binding protein [SAR202 cluster bacterium]
MNSVTLDLTDEQTKRLHKLAARLGVTMQELVRISLFELLNAPETDFEAAADHVISKNSELYRRLA